MKIALKQAEKAFALHEVPVGAVLVYQNEIISTSHNLVERFNDATAHAEMNCIREASKLLGKWRLSNSILYSTLEPCHMCAGAIILSRVGTLVWGAPDLRHGAGKEIYQNHPIHQVQILSSICEAEAATLMRNFFKMRRHENSNERNDRAAENQATCRCK